MNIKPLSDRVVIRPSESTSKTASGIYIPDTAKEKPQEGFIVAAGPGRPGEPIAVKEGDRVCFAKHAGTKINVEGEELLIMREGDLWAII